MTLSIRPFEDRDWPAVWAILQHVVQSAEAYVFAPDISELEMRNIWITTPQASFVACDEAGVVLGTYFIKPNQPALGSHVSNCGYATAVHAQGQGVASAMCEHSQALARQWGYQAMQFNFVISTNTAAVRLWRKHGFLIVGTLPSAFKHHRLGWVDVLVMHKFLGD